MAQYLVNDIEWHASGCHTLVLQSETEDERFLVGSRSRIRNIVREHNEMEFDHLEDLIFRIVDLPVDVTADQEV